MILLRVARTLLGRLVPVPVEWAHLVSTVRERCMFLVYRGALIGIVLVQAAEQPSVRIFGAGALVVLLLFLGTLMADGLQKRLTYDIFAWLQSRNIE